MGLLLRLLLLPAAAVEPPWAGGGITADSSSFSRVIITPVPLPLPPLLLGLRGLLGAGGGGCCDEGHTPLPMLLLPLRGLLGVDDHEG